MKTCANCKHLRIKNIIYGTCFFKGVVKLEKCCANWEEKLGKVLEMDVV